MLEFYYDFLDRYFDRRDFELIHMDLRSTFARSYLQNLRQATVAYMGQVERAHAGAVHT